MPFTFALAHMGDGRVAGPVIFLFQRGSFHTYRYERVLGLRRFWSIDDRICHSDYSSMRSTVLTNESRSFLLPICEPAFSSVRKGVSQIQVCTPLPRLCLFQISACVYIVYVLCQLHALCRLLARQKSLPDTNDE